MGAAKGKYAWRRSWFDEPVKKSPNPVLQNGTRGDFLPFALSLGKDMEARL
jgi:hypothetical protein